MLVTTHSNMSPLHMSPSHILKLQITLKFRSNSTQKFKFQLWINLLVFGLLRIQSVFTKFVFEQKKLENAIFIEKHGLYIYFWRWCGGSCRGINGQSVVGSKWHETVRWHNAPYTVSQCPFHWAIFAETFYRKIWVRIRWQRVHRIIAKLTFASFWRRCNLSRSPSMLSIFGRWREELRGLTRVNWADGDGDDGVAGDCDDAATSRSAKSCKLWTCSSRESRRRWVHSFLSVLGLCRFNVVYLASICAIKSAVSFFHFLWSALSAVRSDCSCLSSSVDSRFVLANFWRSFFIETRSLSNSTLSAVIFIHSIDTLCCSAITESRFVGGVVAAVFDWMRRSDLCFFVDFRFDDDDDRLRPFSSFTVSPPDFYLEVDAESDWERSLAMKIWKGRWPVTWYDSKVSERREYRKTWCYLNGTACHCSAEYWTSINNSYPLKAEEPFLLRHDGLLSL